MAEKVIPGEEKLLEYWRKKWDTPGGAFFKGLFGGSSQESPASVLDLEGGKKNFARDAGWMLNNAANLAPLVGAGLGKVLPSAPSLGKPSFKSQQGAIGPDLEPHRYTMKTLERLPQNSDHIKVETLRSALARSDVTEAEKAPSASRPHPRTSPTRHAIISPRSDMQSSPQNSPCIC